MLESDRQLYDIPSYLSTRYFDTGMSHEDCLKLQRTYSRRSNGEPSRVDFSPEERQKQVKEIHDRGSHFGIVSTVQGLLLSHWWMLYIEGCAACAAYRLPTRTESTSLITTSKSLKLYYYSIS